MIEAISEHTLQINAWIGLCQIDMRMPDALRRRGYRIDIIDPDFVQDGEKVNPDLILTSPNHHHVIVVECKNWHINGDQKEKYQTLKDSPRILATRGLVRGVDPDDFEMDMSYSTVHDWTDHDYLENDETFAVVQFDFDSPDSNVDLLSGYQFDFDSLNDEFPIIVGTDAIPTDYFPFDTQEGDKEQMIISIFQSMVHLSLTEGGFSVEELLQDAHPLWVDVGEEKKQEFRTRVEKIVDEHAQKGLNDHLEKVQSNKRAEWKVVSKSVQALQRKADEFIDAAKARLEQSELDDDWEQDEDDDNESADG